MNYLVVTRRDYEKPIIVDGYFWRKNEKQTKTNNCPYISTRICVRNPAFFSNLFSTKHSTLTGKGRPHRVEENGEAYFLIAISIL
jgi:hypothetical protein